MRLEITNGAGLGAEGVEHHEHVCNLHYGHILIAARTRYVTAGFGGAGIQEQMRRVVD